MLSVVIQAFKKLVIILRVPFSNHCLIHGDWAFNITLHSLSHQPDGIHPLQIHLIGFRDSPDHRSVRNKKVKFI